ncbi:MAG: GAF domain-containing protein [Anaerolineae bacterium]|nr:GAF domain-containing protein [Anaerolineae bacterium]
MSLWGLLHGRMDFEPTSSHLIELALVSHAVFWIIVVWLKVKFRPKFTRKSLAAAPIWINENNTGRAGLGQNNFDHHHNFDHHLWACAVATDKPPKQVNKASQMPATTKKTQENLADSSEEKPFHSNIDLDQALLVVNEIGQNLTTSLHLLDITSICRTVLANPKLKELFNFDVAEICLWNDQRRTLITELRVPENETGLPAYDRTYGLNEGYTGWIAANQKPLLISNTHQYSKVTPKMGLAKFPYGSLMGAPLKVGLKLLGTIELAAAPADAYTRHHALLLEVVANQVAIALDHARLFQESQHKVAELSVLSDAGRELSATLSYDELLHNISRQMVKAFAADDCAIFDFDEATGGLNLIHECADSIPNNTKTLPNFSKEAFCRALVMLPAWETTRKERSPLIFRLHAPTATPAEVELLKQYHCGSIIGLPLVSRDRFAGLLTLFAADPQALADEQIPLAQSLASQAHIALENARLFGLTDQRLQRRIDELAGLQHISRELNSTLDLDKILDLVLEEALRVTHANLGTVAVYKISTGELIARKEQEGPGSPPDADATPTLTATTFGQKMIDRALQTGEAILISDVGHDEDYAGFGPKTHSRVIVPIFYGTVPTGVINLESDQLNFFTESQLRYLESLAIQAAVAIGNSQTYEEQKREREQAGRRIDQLSRLAEISNIFRSNRPLLEVLEDIAYAISESVGYKVVLVSLAQDDPPALYPKIGAGIPITQFKEFCEAVGAQPLTGLQEIMLDEFRLSKSYFIPVERKEIWQGRLHISFAANQGFDSAKANENNGTGWQTGDLLFIPLADTADNIIGLLTVEDPDTGERPTISSIETLEIFANHAATAIENALLFEREQQRRRIADTLRGVAEAISSQLEFDDLLNIVLRELANVLEYDSASVHRLEEDRVKVIGGRAWESSQQMVGTSFSMKEVNPHRLVIETQEPVIIKDVRQEYPGPFARPPYDRVRSWLGVPLTYGANILGLMSLGSTEVDYFTTEDAEVLLAFANQVAVAMQNARLFDEARQQVRQLAALTEVAQSLNQALDLNELLNLVLDAVFDLVGRGTQGSIWLVDNYTNTIKIANTQNISDFMVELFNESAISVDSEPFASVIKSGEVLVIESSVTDRSTMGSYGLLPFPDDVTYVPLKTEQGVIGILAIETVIHNRNMLQLVTTLADLAAVAIDNTRLLENTRQRANEMQSLYNLGVEVSGMLKVQQVMSSVIDNAVTLTNTQLGVILFWDDETQQYLVEGTATSQKLLDKLAFDRLRALSQPVPRESEPVPEQVEDETDPQWWCHLTRQIMESDQPVNISLPTFSPEKSEVEQGANKAQASVPTSLARALGLQAILGVPVRVQNETNGAIFVGSLGSHNFDDHDLRLLSFVANQSAVAIRNAQLVQRLNLFTEELEQRVAQRTEELARTLQDLTDERDRVEALYQITRELSASLDLDRILSQALSLINRAVGISHGSILLLEQGTHNLIYRASLGRDVPLPRGDEAKVEIDYRLAEKVVETNQHQIIADLSNESDFVADPASLDRHSAMAIPLVTGEEVAGALLLFHPEINYFTEDHFKLVSAAASQVATAINNAELYRLITDQADRLGVMLRTQVAEAAKNEAILRGITDGVLVLDAERNVVLFNPKAAEILEVDPVVVENQPLRQILGRSASPVAQELAQRFYDNFLKSLEEIDAGELSAEFRIEVKPKAVIVTLAPVSIASEDLPSVVTVLRDISKEAEIERIKNEFISTVSHELRTPLTSIKGYADLLVSASASAHVGELNPTQRRFIEVIQSNTNRLANLVNDILEISRIETGRVKLEFEPIDIISTIKEVAVSFEGQLVQKHMNFSLDLPESLPQVYADKARVVQILVNLIGNAWRYTPEGGDIKVQAQLRQDDLVQIDVKDTGIGIVEEDLPYIFDRFFRSERGEVAMVDGTGLGLSITKSFVDLLGGDIWVESKLDVGSTFSFTLPVEAASGKMLVPADQNQVLLIDDDVRVVRILKPELEKTGYQVTTTANGLKALEMARKSGKNLGLIILDALLKDTDGFELLAQIKAEETIADVPLVMTALSVDQNGKDLVMEAVDYISTSFEASKIMETVGLTLNKIKDMPGDNGKDISSREQHLDHVLIVSNNPETATLLKEALDKCGCYVQRAFNSQQALDMAASNPDLILVDPKMPEVDGETIIAQLRQAPETKDIPRIVITERVVPQKSNTLKMLSGHHQARIVQSFSADALVAEIAQIDHNPDERKVNS